jgi:type II secretory pathway pseudopilin PulG
MGIREHSKEFISYTTTIKQAYFRILISNTMMLKKPSLNNTTERGYTLIETVVAMALFLGVLIPLVTTVENVMFDRKTALFQKALSVAQTEMSMVVASKNYIESTRNTEDGLVVARSIQKRNPLIEIEVTVRTASEQSKELVVLKRIILKYEKSEYMQNP